MFCVLSFIALNRDHFYTVVSSFCQYCVSSQLCVSFPNTNQPLLECKVNYSQ